MFAHDHEMIQYLVSLLSVKTENTITNKTAITNTAVSEISDDIDNFYTAVHTVTAWQWRVGLALAARSGVRSFGSSRTGGPFPA